VNTGEALLVFLGIPVGFAVVVFLAVSASSWTRGGRANDVARATGELGPLYLCSTASAPDPSVLPREIGMGSASLVGGGASGRW
jgi:hypothetical protein